MSIMPDSRTDRLRRLFRRYGLSSESPAAEHPAERAVALFQGGALKSVLPEGNRPEDSPKSAQEGKQRRK